MEIKEIMQQEERLQFEKFDNDTAWEIGCMLVEMARERSCGDNRYHTLQTAAVPCGNAGYSRRQ